MSLISGVLFTANNFLINQWKVSVGDVVIVRTVIQMVTYTSICIARLVLIKISYRRPSFCLFHGLSEPKCSYDFLVKNRSDRIERVCLNR